MRDKVSRQRALILFDIDGTLLMPGDRAHGQSLLDAIRSIYEVEPDLSNISFAGMLDAQITRAILRNHAINVEAAEPQIETVMTRMGELYQEAMIDVTLHHRLLPGVPEAVSAVSQQGWTQGTLTGNARSVAETKLGAASLGHLTAIGAFGDSAHERGHLVETAIEECYRVTQVRYEAHETVLVGDTPNDIEAARYSRSRVVAVATGRYDVETLAAREPDAILPNLTDTSAFVEAVESVLGAP